MRSIDVDTGDLYVLTPVPASQLAHVNVLLRGELDLPPSMMYDPVVGLGAEAVDSGRVGRVGRVGERGSGGDDDGRDGRDGRGGGGGGGGGGGCGGGGGEGRCAEAGGRGGGGAEPEEDEAGGMIQAGGRRTNKKKSG